MYYKIENFIDDEGKAIMQKTPCPSDGALVPEGTKIERIGTVHIQVRTQRGVGHIPINFAFPEELTLSQCFEAFEDLAEQEVTRIQKEQAEQNLIVPASQMPTPPPGICLIK